MTWIGCGLTIPSLVGAGGGGGGACVRVPSSTNTTFSSSTAALDTHVKSGWRIDWIYISISRRWWINTTQFRPQRWSIQEERIRSSMALPVSSNIMHVWWRFIRYIQLKKTSLLNRNEFIKGKMRKGWKEPWHNILSIGIVSICWISVWLPSCLTFSRAPSNLPSTQHGQYKHIQRWSGYIYTYTERALYYWTRQLLFLAQHTDWSMDITLLNKCMYRKSTWLYI